MVIPLLATISSVFKDMILVRPYQDFRPVNANHRPFPAPRPRVRYSGARSPDSHDSYGYSNSDQLNLRATTQKPVYR